MNIQNSKYHIFELQFCILCEPLTLTTKEVFVTRHIPPVDQVHFIPPPPLSFPLPLRGSDCHQYYYSHPDFGNFLTTELTVS